MRQRSSTVLAVAALAAVLAAPLGLAAVQPTPSQHLIPQSLIVEHKDTLDRLTALASRSGEVGQEARKALERGVKNAGAKFSKAEGAKCARCWRVLEETRPDTHLCNRCTDAVAALEPA